MKLQKLSFSGIKNELSRDELKRIMAGSGVCNPSSCVNYGLTIPCCQCNTGGIECGNYIYLKFSTPIPYQCNCFCQAWGYVSGINDCPINGCGTYINNPC